MGKLEGKVIAVAGGAGGIGTELSRRFAREGACVIVGSRNGDAARAVAAGIAEAGGKAFAEQMDMASDAQAERLGGGLDGFHANAAHFSFEDKDAVETAPAVFEEVMAVNAGGFLNCTRHAVPALLRRGGGAILYTSSGAAHGPDASRVAYSMAKASIHALMRHVAERWGREGIRANVIAPGVIWHEAFERQAPQMKDWALKKVRTPRVGEPNDIASMAALLLSDDGGFVTGQVISVDGGASMRP